MFPAPDRFLDAIDELDFVCDIDLFATHASRHADNVLLACSSVERSEVRCYPQEWVTMTEPAIASLGEARSDTDIVFALARALGLDDPVLNPEPDGAADPASTFTAALDWVFAPSGMTMAKLAVGPGIAVDALPTWKPAEELAAAGPGLERDYPFILNSGSRLPMVIHSRTYRLQWTRGLRPGPAADVNPDDARALGVAQGDWIELSSPAGSIRVLANITELARPGVVHMYHGHPEADVNLLLDPDDLDPISEFPAYRSARCRVDKVAADDARAATAPEEVTS
jgi:anaerobic selenocysteine-containing dehydrogenase